MLVKKLHLLSSTDLLLLHLGYPSSWLVALLKHQIPFCMRVDYSGYSCVRDFLRSGLTELVVTVRALNHGTRSQSR